MDEPFVQSLGELIQRLGSETPAREYHPLRGASNAISLPGSRERLAEPEEGSTSVIWAQ